MARRILVTGGTVFVSKYIARYFADLGEQVVVLNRNTKEQLEGVAVIEADRHALGNVLSGQHFDAVIDVTAYNAQDVDDLARALESVTFDTYVMLSSSAVYPTTNLQPFVENGRLGLNSKHEVWGQYSEGKVAAERAVLEQIANAYIIRPPYLYGPMNNIYREAFVFDCADAERAFRLPGDGEMRLQFFHVRDLCRFIDVIIAQQPQQHVFNVGNPELVSVREWVELCYRAAGKPLECVAVHNVPQRSFFPFYDYQYELDVRAQRELMPETTPLAEGLRESYAWYSAHRNEVVPKPYMKFIDEELPAAPASVR
ncbi:NAD-dependent epimerase/dehydratase family protein [Bifidobacterium pseudolongum]|uniref:NAD-dependent epimerase/dehydratase family protein n=1 Tax=Bifidobacterium pseudolongum TaxID=1694 RepID=UPI003519838C